MDAVLRMADIVTIHVPETPDTINFISTAQLGLRKQGSFLINNARGRVVDIPALISALKSGRLAGCAIDTFPKEPQSSGPNFNDQLNAWTSELCSIPNVILTPHIGAATEEAQFNIGIEVAQALTRYIKLGQTIGSVQFPAIALMPTGPGQDVIRLCHAHLNRPGALKVRGMICMNLH